VPGGEEAGVDAALHEVARAFGGGGEHLAELVVGGEEDAGEGVKPDGEIEGGAFDGGSGCVCEVGGEEAGEPVEAAGGVLVDVGVPGGDERDL